MGIAQGEILKQASQVGIDVSAVIRPYFSAPAMNTEPKVVEGNSSTKPSFNVVIVGAGSGGIAAAASLLKRNSKLRIAVIDPA